MPWGWTDWAVAGDAYRSFNYNLLIGSPGLTPQIVWNGRRARDYLTDVISRRGRRFIGDAVRSGQPFMLELAPFTPHDPFMPAPRDRGRFAGVTVPRGVLFDAPQLEGAPSWLPEQPLTARGDRAAGPQLPQAGAVRAGDRPHARRDPAAAAAARGRAEHVRDLHLRQRLPHGPAAADGGQAGRLGPRHPGAAGGRRPGCAGGRAGLANWRRTSTCGRRSRSSPASRRSPRSRAAASTRLLRSGFEPSWRDVTLIEHHGPPGNGDPDQQDHLAGKPPSYDALRFPDALYVEYDNPQRPPEYYDLVNRPIRATQRLRDAPARAPGSSWPGGWTRCAPASE